MMCGGKTPNDCLLKRESHLVIAGEWESDHLDSISGFVTDSLCDLRKALEFALPVFPTVNQECMPTSQWHCKNFLMHARCFQILG